MLSEYNLKSPIQRDIKRLHVNTIEIKFVPLLGPLESQSLQEVASNLEWSLPNQSHRMCFGTVNQFWLWDLQNFGVWEFQLELNQADVRNSFVELSLSHLLH